MKQLHKIYQQLAEAGATSPAKGLTSNEFAEKTGGDAHRVSTQLSQLNMYYKGKVIGRVLSSKEGEPAQFKYFVAGPYRSTQVEIAKPKRAYVRRHPQDQVGGKYILTIVGPDAFKVERVVSNGTLTKVLTALVEQ